MHDNQTATMGPVPRRTAWPAPRRAVRRRRRRKESRPEPSTAPAPLPTPPELEPETPRGPELELSSFAVEFRKTRPTDGKLRAAFFEIHERLGHRHRSDALRLVIGAAGIDVFRWQPEEAGRHVADLNKAIGARREARHAPDCEKPLDEVWRIGAALDARLFSVLDEVHRSGRHRRRSTAIRKTVGRGLRLLREGGKAVEAYLAAVGRVIAT